MRRREFARLLSVAALWPFASIAQPQRRIPLIGFLETLGRDSNLYREFLRGMQELGYVEGKNFAIEARFADGMLERLPALSEELARLKVDIIVTQGTPGVRAVRQAAAATPIVMVAVGDPVGSGFVNSLARPGGTITGLSNLATDVIPKLLEMLKAAVPKLSVVAVLVNPGNSQNADALKNIQAAARAMKIAILRNDVRSPEEIENAFTALVRQRPGAVIVAGDPLIRRQAAQIAELALRHKLPLAALNRVHAEAGGLLTYGANFDLSYRRAASYVDKILKGAKPADLPVEQPTTLELYINMKTARALGLKIPGALLARADRVIE